MEDEMFTFLWLFISSICVIILVKIFVHELWWIPSRIENHFWKQGIKSPKYKYFLGNLREISMLSLRASAESMPHSHHIIPRVLSFYHLWKKLYGSMFVIWFGPTPRLTISDPSFIREIFFTKSEYFEKYDPPSQVKRIEGDGLLNLKGEKWAHHRKIMHPFFHVENLKLIAPIVGKTMEEELEKLSEKMSKNRSLEIEIEVCVWYQKLLEDLITKIIFGRNYEEGIVISQLQAQLTSHATEAHQDAFIPGYRFLPTSRSITSWRMSKEIRNLLMKIMDSRRGVENSEKQESCEGCPTDLLRLMMDSSHPSFATDDDVVEECKTIFFAGTHTTASMLTWMTVLLAMHPQWQEAARQEIFRVCGPRDFPTKDNLSKLKLLGMIINETLRLYPPIVAMIRRAKADVELNGVHIPGGTELLLPIIAIHHDSDLWGNDAHEFNPMRFANGVVQAAKHPMAYLPFGSGARRCIGQNLAVIEAKLVIVMILQRFSFVLASTYQHKPWVSMLLHPQHGAPIVFQKLSTEFN